MDDLESVVVSNVNKLKDAHDAVLRLSPSDTAPESIELWKSRTILWEKLRDTNPLFSARHASWQTVLQLVTQTIDSDGNSVKYGEVEMEFIVARHLVLTSYLTTTWSIYDRLTDCCGRLAAVMDIAQKPRQNPKLCEDILSTKSNSLGHACHQHVRANFGWPIHLSYKLRNWLVHEGYEEGGVHMFKGPRTEDGFILSDEAIVHVEQLISKHCGCEPTKHSRLSATEDTWSRGDLTKVLPQYHLEIDRMFAALLPWSVESIIHQIRLFAARR